MRVRRALAVLTLLALAPTSPLPSAVVQTVAFAGPTATVQTDPKGSTPSERRLVVVIAETPLLLLPDATREPLRVLEVGTVLRWLDEDADWFHAEFEDFHYGRRVGYVQRKDAVAVDVRRD